MDALLSSRVGSTQHHQPHHHRRPSPGPSASWLAVGRVSLCVRREVVRCMFCARTLQTQNAARVLFSFEVWPATTWSGLPALLLPLSPPSHLQRRVTVLSRSWLAMLITIGTLFEAFSEMVSVDSAGRSRYCRTGLPRLMKMAEQPPVSQKAKTF